jgi:hypothetical protein
MQKPFKSSTLEQVISFQEFKGGTFFSSSQEINFQNFFDYFSSTKKIKGETKALKTWSKLLEKISTSINNSNDSRAFLSEDLFFLKEQFRKSCKEGDLNQALSVLHYFFFEGKQKFQETLSFDNEKDQFFFDIQLYSIFLSDDQGRSPIFLAMEGEHYSLVKLLMEYPFSPTVLRLIFSADNQQQTLFHLAVSKKAYPLIKEFLKQDIPADLCFDFFRPSLIQDSPLVDKEVDLELFRPLIEKLSFESKKNLLDTLEPPSRQGLLMLLEEEEVKTFFPEYFLIYKSCKDNQNLSNYLISLAKKDKMLFAFNEENKRLNLLELLDLISTDRALSPELLELIGRPYIELFYEARAWEKRS